VWKIYSDGPMGLGSRRAGLPDWAPVLNVGLFGVFGLLEIEDRIDHTNSVLK
jgi:hypothetical protein